MGESASVVRVLVSCAFVCGLAWALGWWLRRLYTLTSAAQRELKLLEVLPLGSGHRLVLVAYRHHRFLLALTPQRIQLLAELSSEEPEPQSSEELRSFLALRPTPRTSLTGSGNEEGNNSEETRESVRWRLPFVHPLLRVPRFPFWTVLLLLLLAPVAYAQAPASTAQQQLSLMRESVQILMLLTLIALAPFLLAVMTCFTRIVIVLSLLRVAMGTPQTPPNPVVIGMALFITLFVMAPTLQEARDRGLQPFLQNRVSLEQAIAEGYKPFHRFMLKQVREKDIALFLRIAKLPNPRTPDEVPPTVLIPAFILSEVRTGFEIGFLIAIPFLVVDLVVASVLMGMGMLMVPPMLISLPLKLLLFVLADGWHLLLRGLALSVR